jgi:coproporphyrinogen III oxidase
MRGVGGIFFDYLTGNGVALEEYYAFVTDVAAAFLDAYVVETRVGESHGKGAQVQLVRRGRYAEFNLVYDRELRSVLRRGDGLNRS